MIDDWGTRSRLGVLIVADPYGGRAMAEAAALAGGESVPTGWSEAAGRIAAARDCSIVAVETQGVDPALLDEHLPAIAAAAEREGLALVASLAADDIDLVAAALFGPTAQLLCTSDPAELAAAMVVARHTTGFDPSGGVRETDRDRLRRLHWEIARIAETLARLAEPAQGGTAVDDRRGSYDSGPGIDAADPQAIRQAIRARRLRDGFFPAGLFEDPAWDMLLDLFAAELEGTRVSVSSLCIAAAVAPTTALRWIARMTEAGLLRRLPDPQDRRRAFMALTDRARAGMRGYLGALSRAGLAIA